ncbi:hypothetical protein BIV57_15725 [Mangrovactinospora gilvigrisea]|uniref:DivIVA domain-containing protein n=1 Tax=Mangrovactinospora gilvigrisea TaxID=1428644 RepID=A0A1J7BCX2_9ACTN|nr:DivIVA domain-containing protein [Mangrovactinospora gilvigrisea]OIV36539.1 hypothetical protein BIV57_15725 [Mangrovactinospora gilvigrisea]
MFWFMIAALVVVVGGVALVVLGAGGSLGDAVHDRAPLRLPEDRALTRGDLERVRFTVATRGYRMDEVDTLLDRLGAELDLKDAQLREALAGMSGTPGTDATPPVPPPPAEDPPTTALRPQPPASPPGFGAPPAPGTA